MFFIVSTKNCFSYLCYASNYKVHGLATGISIVYQTDKPNFFRPHLKLNHVCLKPFLLRAYM